MNARAVSPSGFGGAAGFSVFKLEVQEGGAQSALAASCPCLVSKSFFLHVGDVVVRRQNTSRTRVHVIAQLVGDVRVAQVFDSHILPSSLGEECALQTPESSPIGAA